MSRNTFIRIFVGFLFVCMLFVVSCAGLDAKRDVPMKSSIQGNRIVVFPFYDPYYKGRQIQGVGGPFASAFVNKLHAAGVSAELSKSGEFSSPNRVDIKKACSYAAVNRYNMLITGIVTEWIDGVTQWSGIVDVAALSVEVYRSDTCEMSGSASGRQNGTWWTLSNAPTTRFYESLSEKIVEVLLK